MDDLNNISLKPGEFLVNEKEPCQGIYIIKEGQLEVFKTSNDGARRIPLAVIGSGEYIGEIAIIMGGNHTSSVQALTEVKAIKIPKKKIDEQLQNTPAWLKAMTRGLVDRLAHMNDVLKRNGVVDDQTTSAVSALEAQAIKREPGSAEKIHSKPPTGKEESE